MLTEYTWHEIHVLLVVAVRFQHANGNRPMPGSHGPPSSHNEQDASEPDIGVASKLVRVEHLFLRPGTIASGRAVSDESLIYRIPPTMLEHRVCVVPPVRSAAHRLGGRTGVRRAYRP